MTPVDIEFTMLPCPVKLNTAYVTPTTASINAATSTIIATLVPYKCN